MQVRAVLSIGRCGDPPDLEFVIPRDLRGGNEAADQMANGCAKAAVRCLNSGLVRCWRRLAPACPGSIAEHSDFILSEQLI